MKPNQTKITQAFYAQTSTNQANTVYLCLLANILKSFKESKKLAVKADGSKSKALKDALDSSGIDDAIKLYLSKLDLPDGYTLSLHRVIIDHSCHSESISVQFSTSLWQNGTFIDYYDANNQYWIASSEGGKITKVEGVEATKPKDEQITLAEINQRIEEVEELRLKMQALENTLPVYARQR